MFVRLLALLISNHFTCFVCFVINRSLHDILIKGAKMDLKPRERSGALPKCVRPQMVRSNALTVTRTAKVERSPVSPRLTRPALAVICGQLYGVRSTAK
jgi:hypothetical protein